MQGMVEAKEENKKMINENEFKHDDFAKYTDQCTPAHTFKGRIIKYGNDYTTPDNAHLIDVFPYPGPRIIHKESLEKITKDEWLQWVMKRLKKEYGD